MFSPIDDATRTRMLEAHAKAAAVLGQMGRKLSPRMLLLSALVATGVTLFLLASAPAALQHMAGLRGYTRWAASVFSLLLGLEFGTLLIPALTYLMEHTSDSIRGRIFSLLFMVVNGVTAVPVLLTAALSDWFGISHVIAALGVLLVATGLFMGSYAKRFIPAASPEAESAVPSG